MSNSKGRGWAYLGVLLGGAVSIAANVAHSYVPPADVIAAGSEAVADWSPHLGAVVGAVFWPVALFIAVEIFARIGWPTLRRWTALRFLGLLPVAAVAAIVSYRHLSGLLDYYGEDTLTTIIGPLAVDGLMIMASGALVATAHTTTTIANRVTGGSEESEGSRASEAGTVDPPESPVMPAHVPAEVPPHVQVPTPTPVPVPAPVAKVQRAPWGDTLPGLSPISMEAFARVNGSGPGASA